MEKEKNNEDKEAMIDSLRKDEEVNLAVKVINGQRKLDLLLKLEKEMEKK